jgi:hypothetical protein
MPHEREAITIGEREIARGMIERMAPSPRLPAPHGPDLLEPAAE